MAVKFIYFFNLLFVMVYIFNKWGHSGSRFLEGIDAILPGDVLFLRDQVNRERLFYLHILGGGPYGLSGVDAATDSWFRFIGKRIDTGWDWAGGYGLIEIPSIKEWGVFSRSNLPHREWYVESTEDNIIAAEMFMNEQEGLEGKSERGRLYDTLFGEVCGLTQAEGMPPILEEELDPTLQSLRMRITRSKIDKYREICDSKYNLPERKWENEIIIPAEDYQTALRSAPYIPMEEFAIKFEDIMFDAV